MKFTAISVPCLWRSEMASGLAAVLVTARSGLPPNSGPGSSSAARLGLRGAGGSSRGGGIMPRALDEQQVLCWQALRCAARRALTCACTIPRGTHDRHHTAGTPQAAHHTSCEHALLAAPMVVEAVVQAV